MRIIEQLARAVAPQPLKHFLKEQRRRYLFYRLMESIVADPDSLMTARNFDYPRLTNLWGNEGWSASREYLTGCLAAAHVTRGAILECGTGLSTLLLGIIAGRTGQKVWSLEHDEAWARRIGTCLTRHGIDSVEVCVRPLRNYGSFHWYDPPLDALPTDFSLVVCDGPPGSTPGGRSGMLPVMRSHLGPGCVILLDDADRAEEQAIAAEWGRELATSIKSCGEEKRYIELRVPQVG